MMDVDQPLYANYLPDELLLEILSYIPRDIQHQHVLANFCEVNRQWYDVGIATLYENPHLTGHRFALFVRTICPSILPRIKRSQLAGLVKVLNLSTIVHQGSKSTTARLLGRTKPSLEIFIAPQASFAINCWASLSKCTRLKTLDLSLVSEAISYQSLSQALAKLNHLKTLYLPRCSSKYDQNIYENRLYWPPRLEHLALSGSVKGKFLWEMTKQPDTFPPTLSSMSILHCPTLDCSSIKPLLKNLSAALTTVTLRDLPMVRFGETFDLILDWLPRLTDLTIATEYIDCEFGGKCATDFTANNWMNAKPLESLTLLYSGHQSEPDGTFDFCETTLHSLIDRRFLGRLRWVNVAKGLGWHKTSWFNSKGEIPGTQGKSLKQLAVALVFGLDRENWEKRRWHYADLGPVDKDVKFRDWIQTTTVGQRMRAKLVVFDDC